MPREASRISPRMNRAFGALPYSDLEPVTAEPVPNANSRNVYPPRQGARRVGRAALHDARHRTRIPRRQALGRLRSIRRHHRASRTLPACSVKCTIFHRGNSYKCHLDSNGVPYSPRDLDFIAALVIPTDTWYILPIRATNGQPDILLTPHSPRAKYENYKEAWHLLKR